MSKALLVRVIQSGLITDEFPVSGEDPKVTLSKPAVRTSLSCFWNGQRLYDFKLTDRQELQLYGTFQPEGNLQVSYFRAF
jgi:hypothetical protein